MKLKLDENLPSGLSSRLALDGHDVDTALDEGLAGCSDFTIWQAAQAADRSLVTQDLDFSDVRQFEPGTHAGLVLVRLRVPSRTRLLQRIAEAFRLPEVDSWSRCFVIITDSKVRVRRPSV